MNSQRNPGLGPVMLVFFSLLAVSLLSTGFAQPASGSPQDESQQTEASRQALQPHRAEDGCGKDGTEDRIRIGVFYINNATGRRHLAGIQEAVRSHDYKRVCLKPFPYGKTTQAVRDLLKATGNDGGERTVDIIIGPTESDVFVRMREEIQAGALQAAAAESGAHLDDAETNCDKNQHRDSIKSFVPVISGLVTAKVGNEPHGWFFRTNVDVTRRAGAVYNLVNKYWVNSIAIVHANTEFGTRAERAFQKRLTTRQRKRYMSLIYETPPDPSEQLRRILDVRPEAVGFFGEREDIGRIYRQLRMMNGRATPYNPLFLTLVDARELQQAEETQHAENEFYFLSMADRAAEQTSNGQTTTSDADSVRSDEVYALGHDTATIVLNLLSDLNTEVMTEATLREFRDRLVTLLRRSEPQGCWKEMKFANFQNISRLAVYRLRDGELERADLLETIGWRKKLTHRISLVFSVYGLWPIGCALVILGIAALISWRDLRRLFVGSGKRIVTNRYFYTFVAGHFATALILYVFLSETGNIRYDNLLMAAIIALGPSALFRTTFFETPQGKAIGLKQLYDACIAWVDGKLMQARFDALQARVNVIAYNNSQFGMRQALLDVYRYHPNPAESGRLVEELESSLARERNYFDRRRICARLLLKHLGWERLKAEGLVPFECEDIPLDPQRIVRFAAKHCARRDDKISKISQLVTQQLTAIEKLNKKRREELEDFLQYERKDAIAVEGDLNIHLRFLFVLFGFNVERFIKEGLISAEDVDKCKEDLRRSVEESQQKSRLLRTLRNLMPAQTDPTKPQSTPPPPGPGAGSGSVAAGAGAERAAHPLAGDSTSIEEPASRPAASEDEQTTRPLKAR